MNYRILNAGDRLRPSSAGSAAAPSAPLRQRHAGLGTGAGAHRARIVLWSRDGQAGCFPTPRARLRRSLTFWLRPTFVLRVVNRFQKLAGFDRSMALASSALTALTALIPLALLVASFLSRLSARDFADRIVQRYRLSVRNTANGLLTGAIQAALGDARIGLAASLAQPHAVRPRRRRPGHRLRPRHDAHPRVLVGARARGRRRARSHPARTAAAGRRGPSAVGERARAEPRALANRALGTGTAAFRAPAPGLTRRQRLAGEEQPCLTHSAERSTNRPTSQRANPRENQRRA